MTKMYLHILLLLQVVKFQENLTVALGKWLEISFPGCHPHAESGSGAGCQEMT
jgi:hypothetical protein